MSPPELSINISSAPGGTDELLSQSIRGQGPMGVAALAMGPLLWAAGPNKVSLKTPAAFYLNGL